MLRGNVRSALCIYKCVCMSFLTLLAAPLLDGSSLERTKPIRLYSQRAAHRDTEVLHSNFTAISPQRRVRAEGSRRWQPEGEEMGSDSGCIPSHPILSYLLFSAFFSSLFSVSQAVKKTSTQPETHTRKFIYVQHKLT